MLIDWLLPVPTKFRFPGTTMSGPNVGVGVMLGVGVGVGLGVGVGVTLGVGVGLGVGLVKLILTVTCELPPWSSEIVRTHDPAASGVTVNVVLGPVPELGVTAMSPTQFAAESWLIAPV